MTNINPYEKCPIYETKSFILRLVEKTDALDLLKCYSDVEAVKLMNSDNCINNFHYVTIEEMIDCILFWIKDYENKVYVRFSIVDKSTKTAIGTIEVFKRRQMDEKALVCGVLRIDLRSEYERKNYLMELLKLSNIHFYDIFKVNRIIIKSIPYAKERISALIESGFSELKNNTVVEYSNYFIR